MTALCYAMRIYSIPVEGKGEGTYRVAGIPRGGAGCAIRTRNSEEELQGTLIMSQSPAAYPGHTSATALGRLAHQLEC